MTTTEILEELRLACPECLLADGYEDAIVGVVEGCARPVLVVYDRLSWAFLIADPFAALPKPNKH